MFKNETFETIPENEYYLSKISPQIEKKQKNLLKWHFDFYFYDF